MAGEDHAFSNLRFLSCRRPAGGRPRRPACARSHDPCSHRRRVTRRRRRSRARRRRRRSGDVRSAAGQPDPARCAQRHGRPRDGGAYAEHVARRRSGRSESGVRRHATTVAEVLRARGVDARFSTGACAHASGASTRRRGCAAAVCAPRAEERTSRTCSSVSTKSFERASSVDRAALFRGRHARRPAHATSAARDADRSGCRSPRRRGVHRSAHCGRRDGVRDHARERSRRHRAARSDGRHVEVVARASQQDRVTGDLACLRRYLFSREAPPAERTLDGSLEFFSAPGEGREAVEIARRILREARAGVRFDEMAVLVRSPQNYVGLIEHALRRAKVPAWFSRGTRRPLTAGRAFLALLACASEQLSASRFAEYLSFAQVPLETREEGGELGGLAGRGVRTRPVSSRRERRFESGIPDPESRVPDPGSRFGVRPRGNAARALAMGSAHRRCRRDRSGCHALEASPRGQARRARAADPRSETR